MGVHEETSRLIHERVGQRLVRQSRCHRRCLCCDPSSVKRFITKMTKHGYLLIEKRIIYGCAFSNSMTITHDLILAPVAPHKAIPKPVSVVPDLERERVPVYAPVVLPAVAELVVKPTVPDVDNDAYDDSPEWMRGAA